MKFINSRSYLALLGVAAFSVFAIGCESAEEVGENIQELGDDIEDAAD
jgi:predicted small secreted protein